MALGKTITYTPFQETSFGYGSGEIASAHSTEFPNATDIVKVVITISTVSGSHFDPTTGHISTPSSGTAIATFNKLQYDWTVRGERDDVDAVLAQLKFFPSDYPDSRPYDPENLTYGWKPTEIKENQTTGLYANEEPPQVPDTDMFLKVYDSSDTLVSNNSITWEADGPLFGNQRPYWSTEPLAEDLNSTAHDTAAGGLVDFGVISHGSDTDNVNVKCEFRVYGSETTYAGSLYGYMTGLDNIYVGDKKQVTLATGERFNFTGSVAEAQAFLDNIRYSNSGNERTFDMHLTISDGVVGSELTKTCWFSDATIGISTLPDVHYVEDANPAYWDFGEISLSNVQPDVTQYKVEIQLDATGTAGTTDFDTIQTVQSQSYSNGLLTIISTSIEDLKLALRTLRYTPDADFNSAFTMTVDFTFENTTLGSSYSSVQQTIDVTAQELSEVSNLNTTHDWTEDRWYDFVTYPQIIHGYNHTFDIVFTLSDGSAGTLWRHGSSGFYRSFGALGNQFKLSGTRDEVNIALQNLYFAPNPDYDDDFTISFTVDRTSGDLTFETQTVGSFTMNAIPVSDFTFPLVKPVINWENNVTKRFVSGLQITDESVTIPLNPAFGSNFTTVIRLRDNTGAFTNGVLTTDYDNILVSITGNYTNEMTIVGDINATNIVLNELKFVPNPLYQGLSDFYVDFRVSRNYDNRVLDGLDFSPSVRTEFKDPVITNPTTVTSPIFDWQEDIPLDFDSGLSISEKVTENSDYTAGNGFTEFYQNNYRVTLHAKWWDGSASQALNDLNWSTTNTTVTSSGSGKVSDPLIITGSRADINNALKNMRFTPNTPDFIIAPSANGNFWLEAKIERLVNNSVLMNFFPKITDFNAGENISEYLTSWNDVQYIEDIKAQYIFSHIDNFILDGAGDLFDATYDVTIRLASDLIGKFEPYVEEGYLEDTELSIFVNDFEVRIIGNKTSVNEAISNLQFSPFADVTSSVDIHYTQKRTYNNTTVTQANDVVVTTMTGVDTPDYVLGTSVNNLQFFVQDEFLTGLDLTGANAISRTSLNAEVSQEVLDGNAFVTLTPRQICENVGFVYDAPITITDIFEDGGPSLYKVVFDGGNLFTPKNENLTTLGASLNITDTGWQPKETLNNILKDGIYVTGVNEAAGNIPSHGDKFDVTFTVYRKTAAGDEAQLTGPRSLNYYFTSGLTCWLTQGAPSYDEGVAYNFDTRIDNALDSEIVIGVYHPTLHSRSDRTRVIFKESNDNQFTTSIRSLELYGRIIFNGEAATIHPTLGYQEFGSTSRTVYSVYQEDRFKSLNSVGNWFDPKFTYFNYPGLEDSIEFFVWTKWGAYLKVGSNGNLKLEAISYY